MDKSSTELRFLDPAKVSLRLNPSGYLKGTVEDRAELDDVKARAAFPFSRPRQYIELRVGKDELLGFIRSLDEVEAETAKAIERALYLHHFVPLVRRVLSIKGGHGLHTWRVVTDRGPIEFTTRGRRQNVEETTSDEYIVTDVDGNRYRIPRIPDLDAKSLVQLRKVL